MSCEDGYAVPPGKVLLFSGHMIAVHHRPGDARRLVRQRHGYDQRRPRIAPSARPYRRSEAQARHRASRSNRASNASRSGWASSAGRAGGTS
jgi:hypothetical protein